jgi:bacterioferritin (cytochrome b1)
MTLAEVLYITIKNWELAESIRRRDKNFDAFKHLSELIGNKNPSTLRKMCNERAHENGAKLGYDEAIAIMAETGDYRLRQYEKEILESKRKHIDGQIDLFASPITDLHHE